MLASIFGRCTLYTTGCRMKINKLPYQINVGFFNLHKGWLSCTGDIQFTSQSKWWCTHLVSSLQMTLEKALFWCQNFPHCEWGSNLGPLAPETSAQTTGLPRFISVFPYIYSGTTYKLMKRNKIFMIVPWFIHKFCTENAATACKWRQLIITSLWQGNASINDHRLNHRNAS